MIPKKVTLQTIAKMAGCSAAVVSTVLNGARGNSKVSAATREKIQEIAARENYRPNFASRSLKRNSSNTLGIYVQPSLWHSLGLSYEMSIFKGIERAARDLNYSLLILNMSCDVVSEVCREKLMDHSIDGVLLLHADAGAEWVSRLAAEYENVVAVDYNRPEAELDTVAFDNREAVRDSLRFLRDSGHRRIGFIGHGTDSAEWDATARENAFLEARDCPEFSGMEFLFYTGKGLAPESRYCQLEGEIGIRHFLSLSSMPDAVLAYNSLVGVSAVRIARGRGVRVPEDLSIMGIDSIGMEGWDLPELNSVDHPLESMGAAATRLLIGKIKKTDTEAIPRLFRGTLLDGHTVALKR